jgi:hypothetical protein
MYVECMLNVLNGVAEWQSGSKLFFERKWIASCTGAGSQETERKETFSSCPSCQTLPPHGCVCVTFVRTTGSEKQCEETVNNSRLAPTWPNVYRPNNGNANGTTVSSRRRDFVFREGATSAPHPQQVDLVYSTCYCSAVATVTITITVVIFIQ